MISGTSKCSRNVSRILILLFGWTIVNAAPAGDPFIVGVGISIHDGPQALEDAAWLGVKSIRVAAPWNEIEVSPGNYSVPGWLEETVDGARSRGIEILLILSYGNDLYGGNKPVTDSSRQAFARYAIFVVSHFRGRVRLYDIWNEWETHVGHTTPGTVEDYIALEKEVYPRIKRFAPEVLLLSGGMADPAAKDRWIEKFLKSGGLNWADGLSLHPYNYQSVDEKAPEAAVTVLDALHELANKEMGGKDIPIYVTEMGYPAYMGRWGVTETAAAQRLRSFFTLAARRKYIRGVWWYCLKDQGTDPRNMEHHFGMFGPQWQQKAAAKELKAIQSAIRR